MKLLFLVGVLLAGCMSVPRAERVENHYLLSYYNISACDGWTSEAACISNSLPKMRDKARTLCPNGSDVKGCRVVEGNVTCEAHCVAP